MNLIQAYFTELAHDEAYYWMYSRNMAWGYFDHPPAIALLIKIGYGLFNNELGVRLLTSIMGAATILIIYYLLDTKKNALKLYIMLTVSIILVQSHVGGFLAIPDIPVVFFAAVFLLVYKAYCKKDSVYLALVLGLIGALMLYSKYHGILILVFTLAANLRIIRRWSFWLIPVLIALLMLPHLFWQIQNDYPTFTYHLVSRSSNYKFDHTFNYLYSQVLVAGPLVAVIVLYQAFSSRVSDVFDRVLKVNLIGIFVFFLLSSFKGRVEAHWTAIAFIPLLVLAHKEIAKKERILNWVTKLFLPSLLIMVFIRIALIIDFLPKEIQAIREVHDWDVWAEEIYAVAGDKPVLFHNTFQRPSKYTFYSGGKFAHSMNSVYYRKNQFDIWPFEDSVQHKNVLMLTSRTPTDTLFTRVGDMYKYENDTNFSSYYNLKASVQTNSISVNFGDTLNIDLVILNPRKDTVKFKPGDGLSAVYHDADIWLPQRKIYSLKDEIIPPEDSLKSMIQLTFPKDPGSYSLYLGIHTRNQYPGLNCAPISVKVY